MVGRFCVVNRGDLSGHGSGVHAFVPKNRCRSGVRTPIVAVRLGLADRQGRVGR